MKVKAFNLLNLLIVFLIGLVSAYDTILSVVFKFHLTHTGEKKSNSSSCHKLWWSRTFSSTQGCWSYCGCDIFDLSGKIKVLLHSLHHLESASVFVLLSHVLST